jgi:hypothetical protein
MACAVCVLEWFGAGLVCRDIIPRVVWLAWPLGWALPGHMGQCMRKIMVLITSLALGLVLLCDNHCPGTSKPPTVEGASQHDKWRVVARITESTASQSHVHGLG